jgi:type I restriction enzyme M protein
MPMETVIAYRSRRQYIGLNRTARRTECAEKALFSGLSRHVLHYGLGIKDGRKIDPTSGSGSLLITIGNALAKYMNNPNGIRYYAQELKANTYNLTRMNLVMRGILPDNIVTRNGDTLEEDWPYFDEDDPIGTYQPLYVDAVVSNPPYSQRWDPSGKENDPRYSRYGLAPKSKADYAFLLHDLYHLKPDGIMTIVLPHGVLFRGGEEGEIRKNLIEQNNIDAIIGLPANIFFGTGIPTIIMVLQQKRENTDVLIVDASKGFTKEGKNNKLRASDIRRIVDTVTGRLDIPKYSRKVSKEEIRANDYNLNIPRYVDSSESTESWDIYASMFGGIPESELNDLDQYWKEFPSLKNDLFESNGKYAQIKATDIKEAIMNNTDVQSYLNQFHESFSDMTDYLSEMLIDNAENVPIIKTEDQITEDIFCRFENIHLVDKYEAFEIFHDAYTGISGDLELIQAEGMKAVRQVDPNMVVKKKNGRDAEVQEGWKGHILPFDLIQHKLMKPELDVIDKEEERIQEIPGEYESILGEMSEDDKEIISDALNDSNDEFVLKNVASMIRTLKKEDAVENKELIQILQKVSDLSVEEKKLKAKIKKEKEELHLATKARIENLTDEELTALLQSKWIQPITEGINSLPDKQLDELVKAVKKLADKYKDTFDDIETEIRKTEASLSEMLSELQGTKEDMAGIREFQKLLGGGE